MMELLTKSIGLLFAIEGQKFQLIKFDPPFIYANTGTFEVVKADIVGDGVEITPYGIKGDMPTWDYRIAVFLNKKKTSDDSANTVLLANDEHYKNKWDDAHEFAKFIKYKCWIDIN